MEALLRGIIEKCIEQALKPEQMEASIMIFREFTPIIESKEDAMFGFVVGRMVEGFMSIMHTSYKRKATTEEWNEFCEMLNRRAEEIKEKVRLAFMV